MIRKESTLLILLFITIVGIYYLFNPLEHDFFPYCAFKKITGWQCPGCGSQRSAHELLHLNIHSAFRYNALFVFSIPYFITAVVFHVLDLKQKFPKANNLLFGNKTIVLIIITIIIFTITRNII